MEQHRVLSSSGTLGKISIVKHRFIHVLEKDGKVIGDHLNNRTFCAALEKKIYGKDKIIASRSRLSKTLPNTACTRLVGVAAFWGSLRGLEWVPAKRRYLVPPTCG